MTLKLMLGALLQTALINITQGTKSLETKNNKMQAQNSILSMEFKMNNLTLTLKGHSQEIIQLLRYLVLEHH